MSTKPKSKKVITGHESKVYSGCNNLSREAYVFMLNKWAECEPGFVPNNNRMGCNISAVGEERGCRLLLHRAHHKQRATLLSPVGGGRGCVSLAVAEFHSNTTAGRLPCLRRSGYADSHITQSVIDCLIIWMLVIWRLEQLVQRAHGLVVAVFGRFVCIDKHPLVGHVHVQTVTKT